MPRQLPPPADFGPDHRDLWSAAQRQLRLQGTWERTDAPQLEMYVRNLLAARQARADAERMRDANGLEMRAALKQCADAESAALRLATALLLTAEARKRHNVKAGAGGAESELAALIA